MPSVALHAKVTAALLVTAAVLTNAAFTVLGTVFGYPDVLGEPAADVLQSFSADQARISFWFAVMAVSAALFIPIAVGVGRTSAHPLMRLAVPTGVAAGVVQVIGLSRWPLLVPGYASDAASPDPGIADRGRQGFETANLVLGAVVGETLGYVLTAAWTVLVLLAVHRVLAGSWFTVLGAGSAVLVALGVLSPLDLPLVDSANFVGYILWSGWLLALAFVLLRRGTAPAAAMAPRVAVSTARA